MVYAVGTTFKMRLAEQFLEERVIIGVTKNKIESIKNLMKNLKWPAEQAMSALGYSPEEQKQLMTML